MATKTRQELYTDLTILIRSNGEGGKTTGQDVRTFLTNVLDTFLSFLDSKADTAALSAKVDKVAGKQLSTEDYTTAEKLKLAGLESSRYKGRYVSLAALAAAHATGSAGDYARVDSGVGTDVVTYLWDDSDSKWVQERGVGTTETAASVKTKYESNPDTNAFTDSEKLKLAGVAVNATQNATDASLRDRATHTGTQTISTVSGLQSALDGKQATITGAASTVTTSNLSASVVAVTNTSGKLASSSVTTTQLGYLSGVTSNIQTQLNSKLNTSGGSLTGNVTIDKANSWLTLKSWNNSQGGTDANEQGAGVSIGESGYKGGAALHLTYTGDGWANIGMGVVGSNGAPAYNVMRLFYENTTAYFQGNITTPNNSGYGYTNESGTSWIRPQDVWGNMHLRVTEGGKGMYFDSNAFYFRNSVGQDKLTVDVNGSVVTAGNIQLNGNILTIGKAGGTTSTIAFPAQTNDPGYIKHIENNNTAEMRFCVSDDDDYVDKFTFGNTSAGLWRERVIITANGHITATGNITANSDARLKTNVRGYEDGLAKIMQLRPSVYDRTDIKSENEVGFIAQEVKEVEPTLVKGDETLSLDYSRMVVMLTKAVQEQQQQIEKQNNEIQHLINLMRDYGIAR